jgi:hypothetical protein
MIAAVCVRFYGRSSPMEKHSFLGTDFRLYPSTVVATRLDDEAGTARAPTPDQLGTCQNGPFTFSVASMRRGA